MNDICINAINAFNKGGIVIFPTDTAYGIGCRVDFSDAVEKLFDIRRRKQDKAVPILVSDPDMAYRYWRKDPPEIIDQLVQKYWPGALTMVYDKSDLSVHPFIAGGGNKIGIREPDHEDLREIIRSLNVPIIGTSANYPGEKTPHTVNEIDPELIRKADYVLDLPAGSGESTVIDVSGGGLRLIRRGNINPEEIL